MLITQELRTILKNVEIQHVEEQWAFGNICNN